MDTSVLVAGVAGFKSPELSQSNPSACFIRNWLEEGSFTWLVTEEILFEYKEVLARLGVRRNLIGKIVNLLREEAETVRPSILITISPDPDDDPFCSCAEEGNADFLVTLNPKDFPQSVLRAKVIDPAEPIPTTAKTRLIANRHAKGS
ncbi:MAG: PIN domain-containing protein [Acidobacteriaceae bacterium]|nr:PIN domain-containing protein [Acidobacteriaceae bacterium]MBV9223103.1 PIN domain-containing protein [Acidobacteriaceae bacterium]MBV9676949.1 PIN domain-containing protein [Acidobacteriaceae bacterium]